MFLCDQWQDYEVLDTGDGEKLERWKDVVLCRPDPQVIWPKANPALWDTADARYNRSATGGGEWEFYKTLPDRWVLALGKLKFYVRPTGFKHTGLFPEQAANWEFMRERIQKAHKRPMVLNLFAYTGGATVACAAQGA
ncbi:MAG: class I SAM-dependent methyltransferase, partial [Firmicutes bacterium]|nr:class I SAM-dependent methyltransferase [Bacillota bacterium]